MARVIRFTTDKFDVAREPPNPINPIHGISLLQWLREQARPHVEVGEPDAEDWGWYALVDWNGRQYLLGASASEDDGSCEWVLQIDKQRSIKEKLLGREVMTPDDPCAAFRVAAATRTSVQERFGRFRLDRQAGVGSYALGPAAGSSPVSPGREGSLR